MKSTPPDPHEPSQQKPPHEPHHEPRLLTRRDSIPDAAESRSRLYSGLDHIQRKQARDRQQTKTLNRRFSFRKLFIAGGVLTALVLAALLLATLSLRHSMRAALPQLDGTLHATGLSAPVTVTRDTQGVPTIRAASLDDLLFAQGFITAQDRLWQMDAVRRHAAGELAEILGSSMVTHDRLQRTLQIRATADRAVAALPPDQLHQLEAYARGVNAFITTHQSTLPVEFHLLHYSPAPWSARDSLLVSLAMSQDLSTEFPQKLSREKLSEHLPPELLPDLYPTGSYRDRPPTQSATDLTVPREEIEQIPLDRTQSSVIPPNPGDPLRPRSLRTGWASKNASTTADPADLLRFTAACIDCRSGSNNWAVAASRSASGAPLVSNDMHLGLNVPDIWYEAALHTTDAAHPLDVTGFTLPGVPFVIVGRNAHVAWGFTAMLGDVQDVRIEHLRSTGDHTEFQHPDGSWTPVQHHAELIRVRGGRNLTLDVQTTEHSIGNATIATPILSPVYPSEHRALSLSWNIYDTANVTSPFLAINSAPDSASLVVAFAALASPSLNAVFADEHHIGYHAIGRIPIRGPATEHPRIIPQYVLPDSVPPSDEDEDDDNSATPQTTLNLTPTTNPGGPSFLRTAYLPQRRQRAPQEPAHPKKASAPKPAPKKPSSAEAPIVPPAPPRNFTIGSPIAFIPTDALDATQEWSGYIPYSDLPSVIDPASGILATANARITPDDYPYFIANDWLDPFRVERISRKLTGQTHLTPADMLALQNDVHSDIDIVIAQRLAYAIDHASKTALAPDAKRLHDAADILRSWDGEVTSTTPAAAIVNATRLELFPMLLIPQIQAHDHTKKAATQLAALYTWSERNTALELLLQHTPKRWLPSTYANWDDLLTAAVLRGLKTGNAPGKLATWQYGTYHPVEIAHPIFGSHGLFGHILGVPGGTGAHPASGDFSTPRDIALHFGPSERFTADLSNAEATYGNITTGQSGNPASDGYLDQFLPWLRGTTLTLPLSHPNETHVLTLTPN